MKNFCRLILPVLLLSSSVGATDFRGIDWGSSKQQVLAAEKLPIHHNMDAEIAFWNFELAGVDAGLIYRFEDGGVVQAYYLSRHRTKSPQEDYADHQTFRKHFDKELGTAGVETWEWADGKPHSEAEQTNEAIEMGRAEIVTRWQHPSNRVWMVLTGKDGELQFLRFYFEPKPTSSP